MAIDKFLIAPIDQDSGLQTNLEPWLIPDQAWAELNNAYVWRGRVRKRFGSTYMVSNQLDSRLRVQVGTVGAPVSPVPGAFGAIGQMFSIGTTLFTVVIANGAMLTTGVATGTFNIATGVFAFANTGAFPAGTAIFWYPSEPVMGITQYEIGAINNHPTYAFDTQFAYVFAGGAWSRAGTAIWQGTDANFFWSVTWEGITADQHALFTTNFNVNVGAPAATDDPIRWWDGATWRNFTPKFLTAGVSPSNTVQTARIVVPFKDRLLLLNTIERDVTNATNIAYVNRCRFSQNGSPFEGANPTYDAAWLEQTQAGSHGAGFVDATTDEAIVSAEFIKDRLIVYFERSTWELAYTGNEVLPFVWQKINTELGSESEFSTVPFDKVILTVGSTGIHACNGANVERIDTKIPDQIFQIKNANVGNTRVGGIRDYYTEMVYWTLPAINKISIGAYPNRVLVYNYKNASWGYNDDCITAFGYFEQQGDITWATTDLTWQEFQALWTSGVTQSEFRQIVAGNQQGFVYRILPDRNTNEHVMQITNIAVAGSGVNLTIINHTLSIGDFIHIQDIVGTAGLNDLIFMIYNTVDIDTVFIDNVTVVGAYAGGGIVSRVSNIQILSKQWNFYNEQARNVYIAKVDFNVTKTSTGAITVDYYPSSTSLSMITEGQATGALLGNNILETAPYALVPLEQMQDRLWHPLYFQTQGETVQIFLNFSTPQMMDPEVAFSAFELNGLIIYATTSGRLQ